MLVILVIASFTAHYLILQGLSVDNLWDGSGYSLTSLYLYGAISSLIVTIAVIAVNWSLPKFLGLVFLALIFVKAIAGYIFIKNGLNKFENDFIEYNFLAVFFIFMFFDVFVVFKTLNQQDKTV